MLVQTLLVFQAWTELLRHDLTISLLGFQSVHQGVKDLAAGEKSEVTVDQVCSAVACAATLYWKPVRCLQRAAVTARLMRRAGWNGRLVIGYRLAPFLSHAWVELDGLPLQGSRIYQERLHVLETV